MKKHKKIVLFSIITFIFINIKNIFAYTEINCIPGPNIQCPPGSDNAINIKKILLEIKDQKMFMILLLIILIIIILYYIKYPKK